MLTTAQALQQFATDYSKAVANETGYLPQVCHDNEWTSPCEHEGALDGEKIQWQPQLTEHASQYNGFANIEHALELSIHQDIKDYYHSLYSGSLFGTFDSRQFELLQIWNEQDIDRLSTNIIGHIMMQQKLKQSLTVFIGCVVNSEKMLSIDNTTGQVVCEIAGNNDREVLASSICDFLSRLSPLASPEEEQVYQAPQPLKAGLMPRLKEVMRSLLGR
ncbi:SecY-interacting protein [Psychrobium sp. 1_MG-2023]|uniref:SecY-interacting protein n=1 Tax=Psychrobium sp. 1_MG-2023 TaxID=3062624 RepID=UPI000C3486D0|nr:SecY-interacting protein [Psychrobium sp. 1_MG-2023]MDP2562231.1 SecY-interacting protein [Psychrobium sp. 1_MG-2023]PKF57485.1 SecY-interacting protein [Alteromonadales bacterium alter-6D02]